MTKIKMTNFGRVIKDRKLVTNDRQTKSGHWHADFGHFFCHLISRDLLFHINGLKNPKDIWDRVSSLFDK